MNNKPISDWKPSDAVSAYVFLTQPKLTGAGTGRRHLATASDATGSISVVDFRRVLAGVQNKGFYKLSGRVGEYNGSLQVMPDSCQPVTKDSPGFDEATCVLSAPEPVDKLADELASYHASLSSPEAETCWALAMDFYLDRLSSHPAAKSVHHAYRGGLLYHVVGMLRVGIAVSTIHHLNWNALALGILMHDVGKLDEIGEWPGDDYTVQGQAEGHIYISARAWDKLWTYLGLPVPHPLHSHVTHLVLSHHGTKEMGSPVTPLTREAWALHLLDMLDSRLEIVRTATKSLDPGVVVDCRPLGRAMKEWPPQGKEECPRDDIADNVGKPRDAGGLGDGP